MKEKIKGYWKKLLKILKKPEMAILPSNIAFNITLAIIPLLTIVVLIASYFNISIDLVTNLVNKIMPEQVSAIIIDVISGKGFDQSIGIFNIMAIIIASNGTYAVITTSNTLYKITRSKAVYNRLSSLILLFIVILLFVFLLIVPIFGDSILNLLKHASIISTYSDSLLNLFDLVKWPLTIFIVFVNIRLIYAVAPSKNIMTSETTYGAIFTTVGWIIATVIFKFYLSHFARYNILYGNLASVIIMLVWIYCLSYIFVFGMAINASRREEQEFIEAQKKIEEELKEKERIKQEKKLNKKENKKQKKEKKKEKNENKDVSES